MFNMREIILVIVIPNTMVKECLKVQCTVPLAFICIDVNYLCSTVESDVLREVCESVEYTRADGQKIMIIVGKYLPMYDSMHEER